MKEAGFDDTPEGWYIVHTDAIWRATRIILDVRAASRRASASTRRSTGWSTRPASSDRRRWPRSSATPRTPDLPAVVPVRSPHDRAPQGRCRRARGQRLRARSASTTRSSTAGRCRSATRAACSSATGPMTRRALLRRLAAVLVAAPPAPADPSPTPQPACPTEAPTSVSAQATLAGRGAAVGRRSSGGERRVHDRALRRCRRRSRRPTS